MFYQEEGETLWVKDNFLFVFQLYLINEPVVVLAVLLSTDRTGAVRGSLHCMYGVEHSLQCGSSLGSCVYYLCTCLHVLPVSQIKGVQQKKKIGSRSCQISEWCGCPGTTHSGIWHMHQVLIGQHKQCSNTARAFIALQRKSNLSIKVIILLLLCRFCCL